MINEKTMNHISLSMKLIALLMFVSSTTFSQKQDTTAQTRSIHKAALKWSPFHLFSYYPSLQVAFEHRIGKQVTLQWDGGYVFSYDDAQSNKAYDKHGYKAKLDVRYYWVYNKSSVFVAPEFYYNSVDYSKSGTFGVGCQNGDCDYYRYYTYQMKYREPGVNLKAGILHRLGKHFSLEYHAGIAQRFIRYSSPNKPPGESYEDRYESDDISTPKEQSRDLIQPTTSVRIGYIFN